MGAGDAILGLSSFKGRQAGSQKRSPKPLKQIALGRICVILVKKPSGAARMRLGGEARGGGL